LPTPRGDSPAVTHVIAESNLEAQLLMTSEDQDIRDARRIILRASSMQLYKATDYTAYCALRNSHPPVRSAAGTCPPISKSFCSPLLTSQLIRTRARLKSYAVRHSDHSTLVGTASMSSQSLCLSRKPGESRLAPEERHKRRGNEPKWSKGLDISSKLSQSLNIMQERNMRNGKEAVKKGCFVTKFRDVSAVFEDTVVCKFRTPC